MSASVKSIRMPDRLWKALKEIADSDHRTMTAQLCAMVEDEAKKRKVKTDA